MRDKHIDPVVHFEMPAEDRKRMADFYITAFGWQTQMLGPEMGDYVLATTTESDETGRPKNPGAINGGFFPMPYMPTEYCPVYLPGLPDSVTWQSVHSRPQAAAGFCSQ
jgi:predicted enzyme related to lactoylglutathione lyase